MDKNQGYAILKAVMLENGRGFALGEHPTAPSRYVTWACYGWLFSPLWRKSPQTSPTFFGSWRSPALW